MGFNRPSISELITRTRADLESRLPGADAKLRRRLLTALADTMAGVSHGLHGHLDYLANQILADTADLAYLERRGSLYGISRKSAATASGTVTFTGTDDSVIPAGTLLQRSDGAEFTTAAEVTITGGEAAATVTATESGTDGNTAAASSLSLVSPISGVDTSATVDASGLTNGTDAETDASLRARVLARMRQPPHGGADFDYENWALEVSGVTRAWCFPLNRGNGTVDLYFVVDDDEDSLIPDAAKVAEVQAYIDALRPVTADFLAVAPTASALDLTIQLAPDTSTVRAAVEAELADLLLREAEPGDGLDLGTIKISHIREAISIAAGETDHVLTSPTADVTPAAGAIVTLGTITWA